jgi:hypothetical protein
MGKFSVTRGAIIKRLTTRWDERRKNHAFRHLYPWELGRAQQDTPALRARLMLADRISNHVIRPRLCQTVDLPALAPGGLDWTNGWAG